MKLRTRLVLLVAGLVTAAVTLVTWYVTASARRAFEQVDAQRAQALVAQLRREFDREGEEAARRLERVAASQSVQRIAIELAAPGADPSLYLNEAPALATAHGLDFLDLVAADGAIVSSAHWPARFGYRHPWLAEFSASDGDRAFLQAEDGPEGRTLGLLAVRDVRVGDVALRLVGGRRLDRQFLVSLDVPAGMRALLYRNLDVGFQPRELLGAGVPAAPAGPPAPQLDPLADARRLEPLVSRALTSNRDVADTLPGTDGAESYVAIPLKGHGGSTLAVLLVGSSRRELSILLASIRRTGLIVGTIAVALGFLLAYALAAGVTRPIERLADGARAVAAGDWTAHVEHAGGGEVGDLGTAFNAMTAQLADQRERLLQAERVAAWRELARRLAHELKNPLFPLRITVENLQRARALAPADFDEVFEESTATLAAGLNSLTGIVARFGDFARMPKPEFEDVDVNDVARRALSLIEAQVSAPGHPAIEVAVHLDPSAGKVRADPEQVGRALQNLLLNAIDAMPSGGRLSVRTRSERDALAVSISDTGQGLTEEERTRLFTPYYTTKQHGTGLGLAIVQSIVSDHAGRIAVESEPGRGTTFTIRLPRGSGFADGAPRADGAQS